jgi:hypothetical protein
MAGPIVGRTLERVTAPRMEILGIRLKMRIDRMNTSRA